jgi:CrcB protein
MTPDHRKKYFTMLRSLLYVGIGSCIGGISRYLLQQFIQNRYPSSIPLGTLSVNIIGCFIIGIIYGVASKGDLLSPEARLLLATGFCGGFTTFSSFAYENVNMVLEGEFFYPFLYILISVVIGFGAVHAGILSVKIISRLWN